MNKLIIPPGYEIRGELIRIYAEGPDHHKIQAMQGEVLGVTNHMVRGREDVKSARKAYALKYGIGGAPPEMPERPALPKPRTPEEKAAVREAWSEYYQQVKETYPAWSAWYKSVEMEAGFEDKPEFGWRKDSYQVLRNIYKGEANAVLIRDTVKRVNATKRANFKRRGESVPLVWGNSPIVQTTDQTGEWYGTRRGVPWYNALITVNGMKIPGRLRRPLPGTPIQGVTIIRKADGLYAAIKCLVKKRVLPEPTKDFVGVDVGQTDLVALSDGYTERNIRDAEFTAQVAAIQEQGDRTTDKEIQVRCRDKVSRLHLNRKRRITHWLNSDLLPRLSQYKTVFIEKLAKGFKSNHGPLSCMHIILDAIKLRLGEWAREVRCAGTSQICSHCGNQDKLARTGKIYACTSSQCAKILDADHNAARNILSRGLESLGSC